ncbi:MAG TPA: membrane protein insertase YidC [Terriglobales bacterium]|nr:membrane protein insertase YidC [Terriglobales bacterium]
MERRLLLVFVLTFLVILIFQPILKRYLPQPPATPSEVQPKTSAPAPGGAVSAAVAAGGPAVPAPGVSRQAGAESETVVDSSLYRITLTNHGGQVKSWILKQYDDDQRRPLELVNPAASEKFGYPLSLWTYDEAQRNKLNSVLYLSSRSGNCVAPCELSFEYADADLSVRKVFRFDDSYVAHVEATVVEKGSQISAFPMWPAGLGDANSPAAFAASRIEFQLANGDVERLAAKKVSSGNTLTGPFVWAAVSDQYFAAVFLPEDTRNPALVTLRNPIEIPKDWRRPEGEKTMADVLGMAVGSLKGPSVGRLFVGPKVLRILETVPVAGLPANVDPNLRQLIDYGWFGFLSRPLFVWLRWTYNNIVQNWGWAIVIQTLIITLALLPLRISSMKSALKMQKIQPQMNAIKEKYKKYSMRDPRRQEMNQEIAALMKQEKVSPVGGCLPLLIQMPILFAYYRMLGVAIDLRHAPWLWIRDLSSPDPHYILPTLLVISMIATQRMTPQAGIDPQQQKMMNWIMPLAMGFIFYNLAAGLNLYYGLSNLIAISQQFIMNRTPLGREMREMAAKRARKKDK